MVAHVREGFQEVVEEMRVVTEVEGCCILLVVWGVTRSGIGKGSMDGWWRRWNVVGATRESLSL